MAGAAGVSFMLTYFSCCTSVSKYCINYMTKNTVYYNYMMYSRCVENCRTMQIENTKKIYLHTTYSKLSTTVKLVIIMQINHKTINDTIIEAIDNIASSGRLVW